MGSGLGEGRGERQKREEGGGRREDAEEGRGKRQEKEHHGRWEIPWQGLVPGYLVDTNIPRYPGMNVHVLRCIMLINSLF
jgi:hypothetical protein